jgi:hypothetical protein
MEAVGTISSYWVLKFGEVVSDDDNAWQYAVSTSDLDALPVRLLEIHCAVFYAIPES